jgi:hypothetical protein
VAHFSITKLEGAPFLAFFARSGGGWPTQAGGVGLSGISVAGQSLPAARSRFRDVDSASIFTVLAQQTGSFSTALRAGSPAKNAGRMGHPLPGTELAYTVAG